MLSERMKKGKGVTGDININCSISTPHAAYHHQKALKQHALRKENIKAAEPSTYIGKNKLVCRWKDHHSVQTNTIQQQQLSLLVPSKLG
jgi:ribosomal protein S26